MKTLDALLRQTTGVMDLILEFNVVKATDDEIVWRDKLIAILNNLIEKIESLSLKLMAL